MKLNPYIKLLLVFISSFFFILVVLVANDMCFNGKNHRPPLTFEEVLANKFTYLTFSLIFSVVISIKYCFSGK